MARLSQLTQLSEPYASGLCRLSKYLDLRDAWEGKGAEAVVFAPVLARLPSWNSCDQPMPALGVLTLGLGADTLVDARSALR